MKVMLDLNVLLDVLQARHPYYHASASVISKVLNKKISGLLPSHAITTIHYVVSKYSGKQKADESIDWILDHFDISTSDKTAFVRARNLRFSDFEDSVVASLAEAAQCEVIITRNIADFKQSPVSALTPEEFLNQCDSVV